MTKLFTKARQRQKRVNDKGVYLKCVNDKGVYLKRVKDKGAYLEHTKTNVFT